MEKVKKFAVIAALASFAFYFLSGLVQTARSSPAERSAPYLDKFVR